MSNFIKNTYEVTTSKVEKENNFSFLFNYSDLVDNNIVRQVMVEKKLNQEKLSSDEVCFFKIPKIAYDKDYPHKEAFENVLLTMDNPSFNFVYILEGNKKNINLYVGVVKNENENASKLTARDYGNLLKGALEGNFGGSNIEKLKGSELEDAILCPKIFNAESPTSKYDSAGMIIGVPSESSKQNENSDTGFQGIDRLINSMIGSNWRVVIVSEPVSKIDTFAFRNSVYNLYEKIAPLSKHSQQVGSNYQESNSTSNNSNSSNSVSFTTNKSTTDENGESHSYSDGDGTSKGHSKTYGDSTQKNQSKSKGTSTSFQKSGSASLNFTNEFVNKNLQEIVKFIDEDLLKRIQTGITRGLFKTSVYYMADCPSTANRLKLGMLSLFKGDANIFSPLQAIELDMDNYEIRNCLSLYQNVLTFTKDAKEKLVLESRPCRENETWLSTYLTPSEISIMAALPQNEIPGISVYEGVEFGLNTNTAGGFPLGKLMHKGRKLDNVVLELNKDFFSKHTFIAGVTGSGKTTTCQKLLQEAKIPFWVIEPAKTEYRTLIKHYDNCIVFTVGDENVAPLRFNPFELVENENVSSHIDMLKATFCSAFVMEGSMPQLIEEAIYKCYEDKGWNTDNSVFEKGISNDDDKYPTLSDFISALDYVVKEKKFDSRLENDYRGSLVSRFSNLLKGPKGKMLNTKHSVDFSKLVEMNVVFEIESLKSSEDKSLMMGFILSRLSCVIRNKHKINNDFKHITLVEESHRLLSKVEYGDSGAKKSAVETFTDLLAEVRKYGEGLIIVDQIPNKLAPEVIKNTNTKIIHKVLARDDKETVGDSMLMNDKQKSFLSSLEPGQAIVFSEGITKPVHVCIDKVTDTSEKEISDEVVKDRFDALKKTFINSKEQQFRETIVANLFRKFDSEIKNILEQVEQHKFAENAVYCFSDEFINDVSLVVKQLSKDGKLENVNIDKVLSILVKEKSQQEIRDTAYEAGLFDLVKAFFYKTKLTIKLVSILNFFKTQLN